MRFLFHNPGSWKSAQMMRQQTLGSYGLYGYHSLGAYSQSKTAEDLLRVIESQIGKKYLWGNPKWAEGQDLGKKGDGQPSDGKNTDNPRGFDCSGIVYWALAQIGIEPSARTASGFREKVTTMDVNQAFNTPGAFLFVREPDGSISHMEVSMGDGQTMIGAQRSGGVKKRALFHGWMQRNNKTWEAGWYPELIGASGNYYTPAVAQTPEATSDTASEAEVGGDEESRTELSIEAMPEDDSSVPLLILGAIGAAGLFLYLRKRRG